MRVHAEMAATVLAVPITVGARVRTGAELVVLESMKMEIPVAAEVDGLVSAVHVAPGDLVEPGMLLVELTR